ncbi:hypothetical protein Herod_00004 [Acinetobacter phage Herod]|nr:hypothetical protein Herod_00004 [Acinetobacter phage Herod]
MIKLKVALIIVDFKNKHSLKLKFISRKDAFNVLQQDWKLLKSEVENLELNLSLIKDDLHIYLIEW